ncbi:MAG: biotin--[acetyl-CoA-carboxylase] ligase [Hyphomicrobiaceae bacterium]|jgi:BirA family transcriptional regulator, biotin operon repressor / biotin---[acetyl-CoA-carboxylase] ligase
MPEGASTHWTARVEVLDEIDSTNSEAMRRALAGETGPLWLSANVQMQGRGRSGRSWVSPRGNLYASLLFAPRCTPATVHQLSLLAGIAAHDAIGSSGAGPPGLRLKWPNDVLMGGAKVAGVLAESIAGRDGAPLAILGIGINLASSPAQSGQAATHLSAHGIDLEPEAALDVLDACICRWLAVWDRGNGFAAIRTAWLERAGPEGENLAINAGGGRIEGRFAGLDADGSLLLRDAEGCARRFTFGDVTVVSRQSGT